MVAHDIDVPIDLLNNSVAKAGFDENCKISYKSITKQLTIELESVRSELLTKEVYSEDATFANTKRERTAYLQCDNLSSQYLTALPDVLGIMTDKVILEAFHQYLGQPSPAIRPFLYRTHYIGRRGMEDEVDTYGDVVDRTMLNG